MKKILIATACALTLCLTSCASKTAPETETKPQPPQAEQTEQPEQTETSDDASQTESESDENAEQDAEIQPEEDTIDLTLNSEDFPEPEDIEEPEIITLEPQDEPEPEKIEEASEEVENEEPPVISDVEVSLPADNNEADTENASEGNNTDANDNDEVTGTSDSDDDGITVIGGGIDITDEDSAADEKYNEKAENIVPSRSVTLKKFEYLDVTYPGTGWIYMGLVDNSKDIAYFGRKLGTKDTKFSLQARAAGTKIVHFYRNDPLTGKYLDDYLEIIILSENGSNKTHIEAPEYKLPVQKKETPVKKVEEEVTAEETTEKKETVEKTTASTSKAVAATTATATTDDYVETVEEPQTTTAAETTTTTTDSATLLKEAQVLYNEKEYAAALNKLNQFFEYSTDNRDEALYLKGQILEAKSDVRDIKGAIDAYTSLTKNYPASKLWDSANKRIIYLKRFYLEVR